MASQSMASSLSSSSSASSASSSSKVIPAESAARVPGSHYGVSIGCLRLFLEKAKKEIGENATTFEVCHQIIKPETEVKQMAYIYCEEGKTDKHKKLLVSNATVYVSHCWDAKFSSLVETLESFCERNSNPQPVNPHHSFSHAHHNHHHHHNHNGASGDEVLAQLESISTNEQFFWIDIFCVNQHNLHLTLERRFGSFDTWQSEIKQRITDIGHTLVLMSPWDNPLPLTRSWCLLELLISFGAQMRNSQFRLTLEMQPQELPTFRDGILSNFKFVMDLESKLVINSEASDCFDRNEREWILKAIKNDIGFKALDSKVKDRLRLWYASTALQMLETTVGDLYDGRSAQVVECFLTLCRVLDQYRMFGEALRYLQNHALPAARDIHGDSHPMTAATYSCMGRIYQNKGDFSSAIEHYQKSLEINLRAVGDQHSAIGTCYNNLAGVFFSKRDFAKAIEYVKLGLDLLINTLGPEHPDVATSYNNLGNIYHSQGYFAEAKDAYQHCLNIRIKTLGDKHTEVASSFNNLGLVHTSIGEFDQAIEHYRKSLLIHFKTLEHNHPLIATSCNNLGTVHYSKGEFENAIQYFERAFDIRSSILGSGHPHTVQTYKHLHMAKTKHSSSRQPVY